MITIKSDREIELLRQAGSIIYQTHQYLVDFIKPGISTLELDKLAEDFIRSKGATPSFKGYNGYPATLCTSINYEVVHGIPSKNVILKEGDIISVDIGCIKDGYHGDAANTYGVGKISKENEQLLEVTKESLDKAISIIKPGVTLGDVGYEISKYVSKYNYGIVTSYGGHGIGRNLHEDPHVPNIGKKGQGVILKKGMVICIEPMIALGSGKTNILKDGWTAITADKKNCAHFEHMVAITEDGHSVLSDGLL